MGWRQKNWGKNRGLTGSGCWVIFWFQIVGRLVVRVLEFRIRCRWWWLKEWVKERVCGGWLKKRGVGHGAS